MSLSYISAAVINYPEKGPAAAEGHVCGLYSSWGLCRCLWPASPQRTIGSMKSEGHVDPVQPYAGYLGKLACLLLNIAARELPLHSGAMAPSLTTGEGELTLTAGA